MAWAENDVQRVLTGAIPIWLGILAEQSDSGGVPYRCRTSSSRNQSTTEPAGLGVDVLALVGAKHVLAFEVKKTKKNGPNGIPFLENLTESQVAFLHRFRSKYISCYVLFDMHEEFDCYNVSQVKLQAISQLSALAVASPSAAKKAEKDLRFYCAPALGGSSALDAVSRAFLQHTPREGALIPFLLELMLEELPHLNNCVLWFLSDGFAVELTLDELRRSLNVLMAVKTTELGADLMRAYRRLKSVIANHASPSGPGFEIARDAYEIAEKEFLSAAKTNTLDLQDKALRDHDADRDSPSM